MASKSGHGKILTKGKGKIISILYVSVRLESLHFRVHHLGLRRKQKITVVLFTWSPRMQIR
jgi:hypothetical protein